MRLLYGRAGRLTAQNGGSRPPRAVIKCFSSLVIVICMLATAGCAFLATSLKYKGPEGASHSSHGSARTARLGPDMRVLDATSLSALNQGISTCNLLIC